jgi:hypothetical protein
MISIYLFLVYYDNTKLRRVALLLLTATTNENQTIKIKILHTTHIHNASFQRTVPFKSRRIYNTYIIHIYM